MNERSILGARVRAAVGAVAINLALGYALLSGWPREVVEMIDDRIVMLDLAPPPPPPPVEIIPPPVRSDRPEGAAAPPNIRSRATAIVAPPPVLPTPPTPIVAATVAGAGTDATSGAALVAGPGTGSGGQGDGTGGGGDGDGDGGGADDETPPRRIGGRIRDSDYPRGLGEAGVNGTVGVRYLVAVDGRARECQVTQSSGNAVLDQTTCRLIESRFRYRPARDARGQPMPSYLVENHEWRVDFDD